MVFFRRFGYIGHKHLKFVSFSVFGGVQGHNLIISVVLVARFNNCLSLLFVSFSKPNEGMEMSKVDHEYRQPFC